MTPRAFTGFIHERILAVSPYVRRREKSGTKIACLLPYRKQEEYKNGSVASCLITVVPMIASGTAPGVRPHVPSG